MQAFHMGDFVREFIDSRGLKHAVIAQKAQMKTTNFSDMLRRKRIGDDTLVKVGAAIGVDLLQLVRDQIETDAGKPVSVVADPVVPYQRATGPTRYFTLNLDDYDEETEERIMRFIRQQPRKGQKH